MSFKLERKVGWHPSWSSETHGFLLFAPYLSLYVPLSRNEWLKLDVKLLSHFIKLDSIPYQVSGINQTKQ